MSDQQRISVGISQAKTAKSPNIMETILGSCIAICLYDKKRKIGSMAHALLPTKDAEGVQSNGKNYSPEKYVDHLISLQLKKLGLKGIKPEDLVAKIVGGGNMFTDRNIKTNDLIGTKNVNKAIEILSNLKIPIVSKDIGFNFGRRIEFYLDSGKILIFKSGGQYRKTI